MTFEEKYHDDYMENVKSIRADIESYINCIKGIINTTTIPDKIDRLNYTYDSQSVNAFCDDMKVIRKLCLNAMKEARYLR